VVISAFNLAVYLQTAIDSALSQDVPGGPVQVIVVDDGSTDETPQILDAYADRITVIRQPNRGLVKAVERGLHEARGEYIALLDADDEWPRGRLRRHVAILDANPVVGLVYGDMQVIDAAGTTTHPSFFARQGLRSASGRVLGRLLAQNFVSGGASTFRASLLPALLPIAAEAAYPDWWIAVGVAAVAEIAHDPAVSNRYRAHGANMGLDADAERRRAINRLELPWRRWMMWHVVDDDSVGVRDVAAVLQQWRHGLVGAATGHHGSVRDLLETDPDGAARARGPGPAASAPFRSKALLRALSRDPFDGAIAVDLEIALAREYDIPVVPSPPLIGFDGRREVTLSWLHEVLANPKLMTAFAHETSRAAESTLVILAPASADLTRLVEIVASKPLLSDERCDIQVLTEPATPPARALLCARACARLTAGASPAPYGELPVHSALGALSQTTFLVA
jgi:hypothetical protein